MPHIHFNTVPIFHRLLQVMSLLGLVVGKALYEGVLLDLPLAPFFVARLQVGMRCAYISLSRGLLGYMAREFGLGLLLCPWRRCLWPGCRWVGVNGQGQGLGLGLSWCAPA